MRTSDLMRRYRRLPTERQSDILEAISRIVVETKCLPSLRDIGAACGIKSTNGVIAQLKALRSKGCITWTPKTSRSLVVNRTIPILGDVR